MKQRQQTPGEGKDKKKRKRKDGLYEDMLDELKSSLDKARDILVRYKELKKDCTYCD